MFRGDDILKIYDENYTNIGRASREKVHTEGLLHQVVHLWMLQHTNDDLFIMFQKRSAKRELYPDLYDLIQTTHCDPEESYEEAILHSLYLYRGTKVNRQDIIHIGSTRQHIDQGNYHDNALVQVFVVNVSKALFIMPETEEIIKVRYQDYCNLVRGRIQEITLYSLDDCVLHTSPREEWWIREDEFFDVFEPYVDSKR